mmetsp:Transcript_58159/g.185107  ORF Transcript_58159/g.185107 Transcript_58159/m.185107 type:complete len:266 (+) Transcript_58159:1611-2408(+)
MRLAAPHPQQPLAVCCHGDVARGDADDAHGRAQGRDDGGRAQAVPAAVAQGPLASVSETEQLPRLEEHERVPVPACNLPDAVVPRPAHLAGWRGLPGVRAVSEPPILRGAPGPYSSGSPGHHAGAVVGPRTKSPHIDALERRHQGGLVPVLETAVYSQLPTVVLTPRHQPPPRERRQRVRPPACYGRHPSRDRHGGGEHWEAQGVDHLGVLNNLNIAHRQSPASSRVKCRRRLGHPYDAPVQARRRPAGGGRRGRRVQPQLPACI